MKTLLSMPISGFLCARGTYLGPKDHPDYKPTYVCIKQTGFVYAASSFAEVSCLVRSRDCRAPTVYFGECPEPMAIALGNLLEGILGDAVFK